MGGLVVPRCILVLVSTLLSAACADSTSVTTAGGLEPEPITGGVGFISRFRGCCLQGRVGRRRGRHGKRRRRPPLQASLGPTGQKTPRGAIGHSRIPSVRSFGDRVGAERRGGIQKWNLESRTLRWTSTQGDWPLPVDPSTGIVASAGFEGEVWLHDPQDGSIVATLHGHTGVVTAGVFDPDGGRLFTVQHDGGTRVWDVTPAGPADIGAVAIDYTYGTLISPSAEAMAASLGEPDDDVFVYADLDTGQPYWSIELWDQWEFPAVVNDGWTSVALLDSTGEAWVRDLTTGDPMIPLPPCTSPEALSPDGSALLVNGVDLNRLGPCILTGDERRSRVIETTTGEELIDLESRDVWRAAFNPGGAPEPGRYLAVRNREAGITPRPIEIFDLESGELIATYTPENDATLDLRFDPTGRYLTGGTQNGRAFVLDFAAIVDGTPAEEALIFDRVIESGGVTGVRLNADGILAT